MKTSDDFLEKDKELDTQELPLSPLQDLYWPSWFHKLTFAFLPSPTVCYVYDTCQNRIFFPCIPIFIFHVYCKNYSAYYIYCI